MRLGRLFWKFFFAFWLALILAGAAVGSAVWWHQQGERSRIEAVHPRHHHVQHDDRVLPRQRRRHAGLAVVHGVRREALALDVLPQHRDQLHVVVHQQNLVHPAPALLECLDDTSRRAAYQSVRGAFTRIYMPLRAPTRLQTGREGRTAS